MVTAGAVVPQTTYSGTLLGSQQTHSLDVLLDLARRRGGTAPGEVERLLEQAERSEVTIVVAGQFKRGKSTFVNALLGRAVLPTGALPVTAIPTIIRHGAQTQAQVHFLDGGAKDITLGEIAQYVTESQNPSNTRGIERVEVAVDAPRLRGLAIVDTPGIASTFTHNTVTANDALRHADLAVLVIGPEPPIGELEATFAVQLRDSADQVFVVFNKADHADTTLSEHLAFAQAILERALGYSPVIFPINALAPHEARFAAFMAELDGLVAARREAVLRHSLARRAAKIARGIAQDLAIERQALLLPVARRGDAQARFANLVQEMNDRARDAELLLERGARDDLADLDALLDSEVRTAERELRTEIDMLIASDDPDEVQRSLRARYLTIATAWATRAEALMRERLHQRVDRFVQRAADIEQALRAGGLAALDLPHETDTVEPLTIELSALSFPYEDQPTTGLEIVGHATLRLLPPPMRRRRLHDLVLRGLGEALDKRRGTLRYACSQAVDRQRRIVSVAVAARLSAAERTVKDALERAIDARDDDERRTRAQQVTTDERLANEIATLFAGEAQ